MPWGTNGSVAETDAKTNQPTLGAGHNSENLTKFLLFFLKTDLEDLHSVVWSILVMFPFLFLREPL